MNTVDKCFKSKMETFILIASKEEQRGIANQINNRMNINFPRKWHSLTILKINIPVPLYCYVPLWPEGKRSQLKSNGFQILNIKPRQVRQEKSYGEGKMPAFFKKSDTYSDEELPCIMMLWCCCNVFEGYFKKVQLEEPSRRQLLLNSESFDVPRQLRTFPEFRHAIGMMSIKLSPAEHITKPSVTLCFDMIVRR